MNEIFKKNTEHLIFDFYLQKGFTTITSFIMNMTRNVCKNAHEQSLITVRFSIYKNVPEQKTMTISNLTRPVTGTATKQSNSSCPVTQFKATVSDQAFIHARVLFAIQVFFFQFFHVVGKQVTVTSFFKGLPVAALEQVTVFHSNDFDAWLQFMLADTDMCGQCNVHSMSDHTHFSQ